MLKVILGTNILSTPTPNSIYYVFPEYFIAVNDGVVSIFGKSLI